MTPALRANLLRLMNPRHVALIGGRPTLAESANVM